MARRHSSRHRTHHGTLYKQRSLPRWLLIGVPALVVLALLAGLVKLALPYVPGVAVDPDALRQEAVAALADNEPKKARALMLDAVKARPDWAEGRLLLARATVLAGDGASALTALKQAEAAGAKPDAMNATRGHAHWTLGQLDAAEKALKSPIAKADLGYANRILGRVYLDLNMPDAAREALDIAAKLTPKSVEAWTDIAVFRWRLNDPIGAIDAADKAIALNGEYAPALTLRGDLAKVQLGPVPAIDFYKRALKSTPNDPALLIALAEAEGAAGRNVDMLATTRALLKAKPKSGYAY